MANTQAMTTAFKVNLMLGHHALGTCVETRTGSTKDALRLALFLVTATRNASDTVYNTTGELTGTNYTAGGETVTNATEPNNDSTTAHWTPSASVTWTNMTSDNPFDAALLYNDQFTTKRAITVHTFGSQSVTAGNFSLTMPTNDGTTGLIRIA